MAGFTKKLFIGASLAAGLSAVVGTPAQALDITFHGADNIKSYTNQDGNQWVGANSSYLTDGDLTTNVELWFDGEDVAQNVGFTATEGAHTVKVESVTAADWAEYGSKWLGDLFANYAPLNNVWAQLDSTVQNMAIKAFTTMGSGDPNIAEFSLDETGAVDIKMAGWYDLNTKLDPIIDYAKDQANSTWFKMFVGQAAAQALLANISLLETTLDSMGPLQMSEIAKVTINGEVHYAYSFDAVNSGFVAKDDGKSYSGIYSWNHAGIPVESVPEPSTMLGLMAVSGLFAAAKRKSNHNA
jgi:PEP-CTERM motif